MTQSDGMDSADQAVKLFNRVRVELFNFIEENEEIMSEFFELTDRYNEACNEAREEIKAVTRSTGFTITPFTRAKRSEPSQVIDHKKLPAEIFTIPGVVKSVDGELIKSLAAEGEIPADVYKNAVIEKAPSSPAVRGPKEITIELT